MASRSKSDCFRLLCLVLATLSTSLSVAVLGAVGHSYHVYHVQKAANNPWWLPLWPGHFETTGTRALIGASASVTLLNLAYIVVSLAPKLQLSTRTLLSSVSGIVLSTASGLIALFSVILVRILNKQTTRSDTIQTWTCRFSKALPGTMTLGNTTADMSNDKFGTLCYESQFGLWGMVTVLILQILLFVSAAAQWFTRKRATPNHEIERDNKTSTEYSF